MRRCESCGEAVGPDERFCGECGAPVARGCHACGAPLTAGKKFCTSCGTPTAVEPETTPGRAAPEITVAGELRVVSVIFCDLVGFTSRSEALDPDIVRELLSGYFDDARAIIGRHGGTIEKFIGDAVMAVWGVPIALENDAERAVRASLELVDAVHAFGEAHQLEGLAARVGRRHRAGRRHGQRGGGDRRRRSRQHRGPHPGPGRTRHGVRRRDHPGRHRRRDRLPRRRRAPGQGQGGARPVWRAERAIAGALGVNRGDSLEAELVGRDSELRLIKELFHTSTERRGARLVSIVGPPGVGKSRLAWEFDKYADGLALNVLWHRGQCLSYGDGVAYWALVQIVRQRFGIGEQDADDVVRAKLRQGLDELISAPRGARLHRAASPSCSAPPTRTWRVTTSSQGGGCSSSASRRPTPSSW